MLGLPKATELSKQLPKNAIYADEHSRESKDRCRYFKDHDSQ